MGHSPENTIASFQKALDLACDEVETDVWLTQARTAEIVGDEVRHRYWPDLADPTAFIEQSVAASGVSGVIGPDGRP